MQGLDGPLSTTSQSLLQPCSRIGCLMSLLLTIFQGKEPKIEEFTPPG